MLQFPPYINTLSIKTFFSYCNSLRFRRENERMREIGYGITECDIFFPSYLVSMKLNPYALRNSLEIPLLIRWKWFSFMRLYESYTNVNAAHNSFVIIWSLFTKFSFNWTLAVLRSEIQCIRSSSIIGYAIFSGRKQCFVPFGCMELLLLLYKDVFSYAFNAL